MLSALVQRGQAPDRVLRVIVGSDQEGPAEGPIECPAKAEASLCFDLLTWK